MEQINGTPKTLDQMFEQLNLDEFTETKIRKALLDYFGNQFNLFCADDTKADIAIEIYKRVMNL